MADRLLRKQFIAAKIQPTAGTFTAPTLADTLIVGDIKATPLKADFAQRKIMRGFLGANGSVLVKKGSSFSFAAELVGSGVAGTPPQHGKLLRAAAMNETILASAHTGTAQAGSTTSTIKLAAGASAVNDAYQGMLITTTGGTGSNQEAVITDYDGTSKVATIVGTWATTPDATTTYNIPVQVAYNPISDNFEMLSLVYEDNGVYHKAADVKGSCSFMLKVGEIPEISFDTIGLPQGRVVGALAGIKPSIPEPAAVLTANTSKLHLNGVDYSWQEFKLDLGVTNGHAILVGQEFVQVSDRVTVGSIVIDVTATQEDELLTLMETPNTLLPMWVTHATGAGNRHVFGLPRIQLKQTSDSEIEGRKLLGFDIEMPPSSAGGDDISYALV